MAISVVDPISPAIERTRQILFRPFDLGKWFVLGFCSWLAHLGQSGGGGGGGAPTRLGGRAGGGGGGAPEATSLPPELRHALDWVMANLPVVIGIGLALLLVLFLIGLLVIWLQSRFTFIFLDNVVHNRVEIAVPWREFRAEGNSLFGFQVLLSLTTFLVVLAGIAVVVAIAWADIQAGQFGGAAVAGTIVGVLAVLALALTMLAIHVFLNDFVVPIMYLRRQGVVASWAEFRQEFLARRQGKLVLYLLFKVVVVSLAVGLLSLVATCATCCLAVLPYLGSVILLPFSVFVRQYSLFYLEQYGPPWQFFSVGKPGRPDLDFLDA